MKTINDLKTLLKSKGYAMNRRWQVVTSVGTLDNTKLGGWSGLEMWLTTKRADEGGWDTERVAKMQPEKIDQLYKAVEEL